MLDTDIQGGIAVVSIDMPGRSMNVIDWDLAAALDRCMTELGRNADVTGIILTSAKPSFVAGADLAIMATFAAPGMTLAKAAPLIRRLGDPLRRMEQIGKPIVAAAPGTALGGGLEIMLACHYRIAAANDKALFGLPEVGLGLLPGAGGTQRLPRQIGLTRALPVLTGGKPLTASEALSAGILQEVVPPHDLIPAARRALAEGRVPAVQPWDLKGFQPPGLAVTATEGFNSFIFANAATVARPGPCYPAPGAILSCVYEGLRLPMDRALVVESQYFGKLATGPVAQALIASGFFLRQRMAKRGIRRIDPADPGVARLLGAMTAALTTEAARLMAEGTSANRVNTAARRAGLPEVVAPAAAATACPAGAGALDRISRRLLLAAALAAAGEGGGDPDATDLAALDLGGFPAWTGGPLYLIDRTGAAELASEAAALGLTPPAGFASRPPFRKGQDQWQTRS